MPRDLFGERETALEYEFFHKVDQKLWRQLKEKLESEKKQKLLAEATGITDHHTLEELVQLGVSAQSIYALSLFPLVWVAWADGHVEEKEREAIMEAAHSHGHEKDTASHELLAQWLEHEPDDKLKSAWTDYIHEACRALSDPAKQTLKNDVLARSRGVAKAAGGILGFHKISAAQEKVLERIEKTFHQEPQHGNP